MNQAVTNLDAAAAHVDRVQARPGDLDALQHDVLRVIDFDAVLVRQDRQVAYHNVVGRHNDAAPHDGPGLADELLRVVEDERAFVDTGLQPDGGRLRGPRDRATAGENDEDGARAHDAEASELASVLAVGEAREWK